MTREQFLKLLEQSKQDDNGNLYIDGAYDNKMYFGLINTICFDFVDEYCLEKENKTYYYDRHFTDNDDTIEIDIVRKD